MGTATRAVSPGARGYGGDYRSGTVSKGWQFSEVQPVGRDASDIAFPGMNRIVLVSDATKEFPKNTPSSFKVRLPVPLELKGEG